jgi:hypothetical protein
MDFVGMRPGKTSVRSIVNFRGCDPGLPLRIYEAEFRAEESNKSAMV